MTVYMYIKTITHHTATACQTHSLTVSSNIIIVPVKIKPDSVRQLTTYIARTVVSALRTEYAGGLQVQTIIASQNNLNKETTHCMRVDVSFCCGFFW